MRKLICASMAALGVATAAHAQEDMLPQQVEVVPGLVRLFRTPEPFKDVIVGRPDAADVQPLSDQSVAIIGKAVGLTSVVLLDGRGRQVANLFVNVARAERADGTIVTVRHGHDKPNSFICNVLVGCRPSDDNKPFPTRAISTGPVNVISVGPTATPVLPMPMPADAPRR